MAPLKKERLELQGEINRLTFEVAIAPEENAEIIEQELSQAQGHLTELEEHIAPLQKEIDQLSRQFWVSKEKVKENKYDLSTSRYRIIEEDLAFYEKPQVILERLSRLEQIMVEEISELDGLL